MAYLRRALDFIEAAEAAACSDEFEPLLKRTLAEFGISYFALLGMQAREGSKVRAPVRLNRSCNPVWSEHYEDAKCYNVDPGIHLALRQPNSFSWTDFEPRPMSPAGRKLFAECRDHLKVDGGFIVPAYDEGGFSGLAAFFHEQHALEEEMKKPLRWIAMHAMERAKELHGIERAGSAWEICPLTPRQREMLAYSASGKSDWDVSQLIGRSEKTVNHHFERAKRTLGVKTRAQAVAIAVHRGWVAI